VVNYPWVIAQHMTNRPAQISHLFKTVYTVSTKKTNPVYVAVTRKQWRILAKFYANTETLNDKQDTEF